MTIKAGDKILIKMPYASVYNGWRGVVSRPHASVGWWYVSLNNGGSVVVLKESELCVTTDISNTPAQDKREDKKPLGAAFYCVMNMSRNYGPPKVKHATYALAQTEAERLARVQPGDTFVVLKAVAQVKIPVAEPDITELA